MKTVESLSISSVEEADLVDEGEESDDVSDGDEMAKGSAHTFSQPPYHSQDPCPYTEMRSNTRTSSDVSQVN